ncbi:hypothetical protein [Haloterrigena salinisoli]|uniref:hypothetical protein n=1 Tax=Haloterrigena salinisoli TaxID=3132747 RepID=UPI0030D44F8D
MTEPTTWTVDHRGPIRFPLRVAVTLAGMPRSILVAFFVAGPLVVAGIVAAVGEPGLTFAAGAWFIAVLFVWFTSAGAARTEYTLETDARRLEIERVGVETDNPLVPATGDVPVIDLDRVESVGAFSLPGTTVLTVSYAGVNVSEPTAFEISDADLPRVRTALEAAGLALPTDADGAIADRRTQYLRGSAILVALGLTIVGPALALAAQTLRGSLSPSVLGGIGLALAGVVGAVVASRLPSFPSYDGADGLSDGLVIRTKRRLYLIVGAAVGVAAFLGVVVGVASLAA